jgi:Phage tail assembly chaperone protein
MLEQYLFVEDTNNPIEYAELPLSFRNISNFYVLDESIHRANGFYPLIIEYPDYDAIKYRLIGNGYQYDEATQTYKKLFKLDPLNAEESELKEPTTEEKWIEVRNLKFQKLSVCDWVDLPSARAKLTAEEASAWDTYRQALRDATKVSTPDAVVWPKAPWSPILGRNYEAGILNNN